VAFAVVRFVVASGLAGGTIRRWVMRFLFLDDDDIGGGGGGGGSRGRGNDRVGLRNEGRRGGRGYGRVGRGLE